MCQIVNEDRIKLPFVSPLVNQFFFIFFSTTFEFFPSIKTLTMKLSEWYFLVSYQASISTISNASDRKSQHS